MTEYSTAVTPTPSSMPRVTSFGCGCRNTAGASAHSPDTTIAPDATAYSFAFTAFGSNRYNKFVALMLTGSDTKLSAATAGADAATTVASHRRGRC